MAGWHGQAEPALGCGTSSAAYIELLGQVQPS